MIILPVWAAVLVVFLFIPVGLAAYSFGWWLRGRYAPVRYIKSNVTTMTAQQAEAFDRVMDRADEVFKEARRIFK